MKKKTIPGTATFPVPHFQHREYGLTWQKIVYLYNSFPLDIIPCKTISEAKMYTCALFSVLSLLCPILVFVALYVYKSAKNY